MTAIRIEQLTKRYDRSTVVDNVSLRIEDGELFFLLGPSGCGKTTLLRTIAGFLTPDNGNIYFDDRLMTQVAPKDRGTGMVFQNYALWPHMTVTQNIAFGLEVRGVPRRERERLIAEAVALVRLTGLEKSRPAQLSGGQQQRVALARALVIRPNLLLLDEPLSNLDARLRTEMREEIRRVHEETKVTTIYVTHDQKEALSLASRMAVMHRGRVVQVGPPRELYQRPRSEFVANFLGETNLIEGRLIQANRDRVSVETQLGMLEGITTTDGLKLESRVQCCVRPECIALESAARSGPNRLRARVEREVFLGEVRHVYLRCGEKLLTSYQLQSTMAASPVGGEMDCVFTAENVVVLPRE